MARNSVQVGDMINIDRARLVSDLDEVKRKLEKALRKPNEDKSTGLIDAGIKEIAGEKIIL